jgi:hypothetical protein
VSPDFELKAAIIARLKADATVASFVGTKVYDRPPEKTGGGLNVTSPYISMGPWTSIPDDYDCMDGVEITGQVDAWSWGSGEAFGSAEVSKIADAVRRSLHDAEFSLSVNALVAIRWELTRILRDPDGVTNHAAIQFTATVETP